ncbi:pimeloyl-CoA dehydrogenase small subunit [Chelativorans sp. ZYF759]|uniref:acyl-CoA dehydrogenase family protein n=1 Tax=Chelativorans sp. ZYF759 TaxID=2692213 RepID=UPI00145D5C9A|nr:acyl-CoA dehydrogenase family protein [Chelativorans sp. ZYF759]NMG40976.1 pimeloyl-CoA dehydrogenase small subunit [Chelativorans sp. ZYF759]
MDFDLTEEQSILKDSLNRLLADTYGFEQRRKHMGSPEGWSGEMWGRYGEMGLMALPFSEADGGLGGSSVETMIVMEAMGRALVLEPYFSTVVLGGSMLRFGASEDQRAEYIPQVAEGALKLALAYTERNSRYELHNVETVAQKDGDGWVLTGAKSVVLDGDSADWIFVTARSAGGTRDADGIGIFMVDAKADGLSRRGYVMQDGRRGAELRLDKVRAAAIGEPENGLPLLCRVVDAGIAALCAEAIGTMDVMRELTVDYLKTRKQFGVPIGAFQVLQHAAVDMFVATEQARSLAIYATMMADSEDAAERGRAMHAAKAEIGRAGKLVGENAIQLHGGVGMTMEYAIGHYFKRMSMIDIALGDHEHHLRTLAEKGGLVDA